MNIPNIQSFVKTVPMIYAYNTPGIAYHDGWTKIGYTEKQSVEQRIKQQTHTAGIRYEIAWQDNAMYKDGSGIYFTDHDFHDYLENKASVPREKGTEWFHVDGMQSLGLFQRFASRKGYIAGEAERKSYVLREEQQDAVGMTKDYFDAGGREFLWNAKPRFGKTLSSYDLVQRMNCQNVLIVTNRPSISNSWADDFYKFIGWREKYCFVSDTDALSGRPGVMSRDAYVSAMRAAKEEDWKGMIAFESLQGLKGSVYFGGKFDKLKWMSQLEFDLLIVDESHEGVDTMKTERAFDNIKRKHTLYLSGTPFKQIAGEQFSKEQIYNWSYADEQEKKETWSGKDYNPYEQLPRLAMFTYQLSPMIREKLEKGLDLSGDMGVVDYTFDLNEFFATNETGKFIREAEIRKFLHALSTQEKYPFSTPELRAELSHTMWYLNRVASVKALAKLLEEDEVFKNYHIVIAAGDGKRDEDDEASLAIDKVKKAVATYDKTITLTVGQLTVGVTIPEWSGVLMLCNMQSPSSYMQAAFRAQNPYSFTKDGKHYRKETAYVFDFDPARTLIIFDEFANNLSSSTVGGRGTADDRKENIRRLLNFFPVIGEDSEGKMVELDASAVLSIPRKLKSQEVVRRGFMSNFLFKNISNIFGAPTVVTDILSKIAPAQEERGKWDDSNMDRAGDVPVNDNGEVEIPEERVIGTARELFGDKIYEELEKEVQEQVDALPETPADKISQHVKRLMTTVKDNIKEKVIQPAVTEYGLKKGAQARVEKQLEREIETAFGKVQGDYEQQTRIAQAERERKLKEAITLEEFNAAEDEFQAAMEDALSAFSDGIKATVQKTIEEKPKEVAKQMETLKATEEKKTVEDEVRAHLRGFARTIPSFIMAYGDGHLTLANFDDYTEDDVFEEVTGITEDDFRFLRDGGNYTDPETGEEAYFPGNLFDEVVFNDSIEEFWKKKAELADYFDEEQEEDIFDYIPPQRTNQIFTPRWIVSRMLDQMEENNPGCFDDPNNTFADLYMKSGLYITEVVKRLYRSDSIKNAYPDDKARIRHILEHQVYGMAPTRIIHLIATNYILGFDEKLKISSHNFVQADASAAAQQGKLTELINESFGEI